MTGPEYRAIRVGQGLTRLRLAHLLSIDPSTIERQERSVNDVPREREFALLHLVQEREKGAATL